MMFTSCYFYALSLLSAPAASSLADLACHDFHTQIGFPLMLSQKTHTSTQFMNLRLLLLAGAREVLPGALGKDIF